MKETIESAQFVVIPTSWLSKKTCGERTIKFQWK